MTDAPITPNVAPPRRQRTLKSIIRRNQWIIAFIIMIVGLGINLALQPNLFSLRVLNGNLRVFLPLMIVAAGQTIVIIGGGIDLSVGTIVSMVNAVLVTQIAPEAGLGGVLVGVLIGCLAGIAAGAFNGFCVAYLRLQPIVTTYATSFVFSGVALWVLPRPGGSVPSELSRLYRATPLNIPFVFFMIIALILVWLLLRSTRYASFLYATGGKDDAAYASGVPVVFTRFSTYVLAGLFSALAALALTASTGTGDPRIGHAMTLTSIVAVVLGGTRLSGGQGSVLGTIIGVMILGTIRNIISFAEVPTWSQTLVDALIILAALAGPGIVMFISKNIRRQA